MMKGQGVLPVRTEPDDVYADRTECVNYYLCGNTIHVDDITNHDGMCEYCRGVEAEKEKKEEASCH